MRHGVYAPLQEISSVWLHESVQTKHAIPKNRVPVLVEAEGFEPTTSCLQSRRSPSELRPQQTLRNMPGHALQTLAHSAKT